MMNLKQAMAALALGIKVRRITWPQGEYVYMNQEEILDETGSICWESLNTLHRHYDYDKDATFKWEILNAQETDE